MKQRMNQEDTWNTKSSFNSRKTEGQDNWPSKVSDMLLVEKCIRITNSGWQ